MKNFLAQTNKRLGFPQFFLRPENPQFCIFKSGNPRKIKCGKIGRQQHDSAVL
jgi:hypothetical protein